MTTIDTTTAVTGTAYSNQRKIDRCQNGVVWATFWNGTSTTTASLEFWFSTDDGATWAEDVSGRLGFTGTSTTHTPDSSFFIDLDDYAHLVYRDRHDDKLYYRRGTPNGACTAWTWASSVAIQGGAAFGDADVVAHREGTGWVAHVAFSTTFADSRFAFYAPVTTTSGGSSSVGSRVTLGGMYSPDSPTSPSIDFNHTGDGKTVAGSTPHLYVVWDTGLTGSGKGIRFKKATYTSGPTWTWGTDREIDSGSYAYEGRISSAFDGSRCVMVYADSGSTSVIKVRERDSGDTTTTARTPTALSDGVIAGMSVTYDGDGDIHLWAVGTTSDDVKRIEYDRSAGTWGSWVTVATATAAADSLSVKRGYSGSSLEAVWTDGSSSPYDIEYAALTFNAAPNAPTWTSPEDNSAASTTADLTLDWAFSDPDVGDTQSAYAISRSVDGGALSYWSVAGSAWTTETKNTSTTSALTLSSWGSAGESHEYKVKTWDAADAVGPYGSALTVLASTPATPTLDSPATDATVAVARPTLAWTVSEQTSYQFRLLESDDTLLFTTGKVASAVKAITLQYDLANGATGLKFELSTWNDEDLQATDTNTGISVDYTPPATPVLTVTANAAGYISVAIADPTPTGSQPTVDSHDIYVRVAAGGRQSGQRTVNDDGIRISTGAVPTNGTYLDYGAATNTDFEYRTLAVAGGSTGFSAWT